MLKLFRPCLSALGDDIDEVMRQNKGLPLPLDAELLLEVAQYMSKVNVEQLAVLHNHNVIGVTVSNPQDVGGHAVSSTGKSELMDCLIEQCLGRVVVFQPRWWEEKQACSATSKFFVTQSYDLDYDFKT